jgi:hypothetical protein
LVRVWTETACRADFCWVFAAEARDIREEICANT